jgi:hypothetical protein
MVTADKILTAILLFGLSVAGTALAVWPTSVQAWILDRYQVWRGLAAWNPCLSWMKTSAYPRFLRSVGIAMIAAALIVLAVI